MIPASRSSNEAEEDAGMEAKEEVQGVERLEAREQMQAQETRAPPRRAEEIRLLEQGASK